MSSFSPQNLGGWDSGFLKNHFALLNILILVMAIFLSGCGGIDTPVKILSVNFIITDWEQNYYEYFEEWRKETGDGSLLPFDLFETLYLQGFQTPFRSALFTHVECL